MNKKLFSVVLSVGLITGIGIADTSSASAMIQIPSVPARPLTPLPAPAPVTSTLSQVATNVGAVARAAGGWGILGKVAQVIYVTARSCPECFAL